MIRRLVGHFGAIAALIACAPSAVPNASDAIALVGATVINVDGRPPIANATVLISGRRIANVGAAGDIRIPERATRIDVSGAYIIPGLWDMHTHLSKTRGSALSVLVANGVTSVRDMGGEMDELLRWRDEIRAGERVGPRMLIAGPYLESPTNAQRQRRTPVSEMAEPVERTRIPIGSRADAERVIDSIKLRGVNHVKIRTVASLPVYRDIAAVAKERGLALVGHADRLPFRDVVASGQRSIEHATLPRMDSLTPNERAALFAQYARQGSGLVPTLVTAYGSLLLEDSLQQRLFAAGTSTGNPRRPRISRFLEIDWREQLSERDSATRTLLLRMVPPLLAALRDMRAAGVPIMAGSDVGVMPLYPGESLHDELELLVRHLGMTPLEAITAATRVPATFVGVGDSVGTIAPGKVADLVVLEADPRADIGNVRRIRGVMLAGRWFDRGALDALLNAAARAEDVQRNDWVR
ncbi:MAG TPA: amidohydrolase family protein [Gemmatimonadaceae bacterium]|nr:amidohydrolase family protein [Gemmatimonadaceae bacterium]